MVLAQEKYAVKQKLGQPKVRLPQRKPAFGKSYVKFVLLGSIVGIFCLGILLTAQFAKIASAGFQVVQLKQEIAALETMNERLYLKTLQLQSLDRIEEVAVNQLGMVAADPGEKQQLAVSNHYLAANEDLELDAGGRQNVILVEQQGRQLNPIIQAISRIIR